MHYLLENITQKVVVTGGSGFIGSNLSKKLFNDGYSAIIIDNLSTGRIENLEELEKQQNFKFVKGSINDLDFLKQFFKDANCIFHQAAIPSVQRSIENPILSNETNINSTLNVFRRLRLRR